MVPNYHILYFLKFHDLIFLKSVNKENYCGTGILTTNYMSGKIPFLQDALSRSNCRIPEILLVSEK